MRGERLGEPLIGAVAGLVAGLALAGSTGWPWFAVPAAAVAVGGLFWAVVWATTQGTSGLAGRVGVGVAAGLLLGELAALVVFSGQIDDQLTAQASPRTALAAAALDQARASRAGLDEAVADANRQRDEALVVARCEFNPSPDCPQVRITGVPGTGPEARTANEFLDDAQRRLDTAIAERDSRAAGFDTEVAVREQVLTQSREDALAGGLGARWQAMNTYTVDHPGSLVLRVLVDGFFIALTLLPLGMRRWRGATTQEAQSAADTAIAVKRAEVRAQVDQMWAEQELNSARMAIAAQNEIDAERQRRRVAEALEHQPEVVVAQRVESAALPAAPETSKELEPHRGAGVPLIPDVTKAAVRFIRPFVPPVVGSAVDGVARAVTKPLRQVFTETEEFHFTLKRTHKVTVETEGGPESRAVTTEREWVDVSGPRIESRRAEVHEESDGYRELSGPDGPRQLPPG
ncbi:DUF4407 domain-containing protein [Mycobacterium sp. C31M]